MAEIDPVNLESNDADLVVPYYLLQATDVRHRNKFRYYQTGSPFEYELIRKLYTEKRKLDIKR